MQTLNFRIHLYDIKAKEKLLEGKKGNSKRRTKGEGSKKLTICKLPYM